MVKLLDSQNQTSSSVDDCLEPNDAALWQASKGDIAVIHSAQDQTLHPMVDWPAAKTPGKIPVGRAAGAGNIWAARAASTLNKLTNVVENIIF